MQPIVFKVKLLRGEGDLERSAKGLLWLLEALCQINQGHLAQFPYPSLYESGVHYQRENGTEEWLDIPSILEAGWGDCEDLACWRVAELRHKGFPAAPWVKFRQIAGVYHFHALVMHFKKGKGRRVEPDQLEDPSKKLGMGWEEEFARTHPNDRLMGLLP